MAGKTLTAMISLAGKVDASLSKAIQTAQKQVSGLGAKLEAVAGSKGVQAITSGAKKAAKAMGAVALAGGAASIAIGKQALDSYATYEQMAGGVETLFGNAGMGVEAYAASVGKSVDQVQADWDRNNRAQQTVMQNAKSAWNQAGVSANDYMRQATSFSASLIQSLGGDTEAAARYTDMAIKDMSDNASKMGTDLGTLQNTYQSLMRGNYAIDEQPELPLAA